MEFFKACPNIDFLGIRRGAACFSVAVCLLSIILFFYHGLNLSLDFTGGSQIELIFQKPADINHIRHELSAAGFQEAEIQNFGGARSVVVTLAAKTSQQTETPSPEVQKQMQDQLIKAVLHAVPEAQFERADFIGAKVSSELTSKGVLAVIAAMIATMIYIAFRFEYRLAFSAAVALLHDPILILGVFSVLHIPFDLTSLAAVLTILGYSLHDSIVVFDRVRENFRKMRKGTAVDIVNGAINQTLSRTIMSSGLTLTVVLVLFLIGGPSIHAFSLALIIGILIGTYSSIYVAGSFAVFLGLNRSDLLVAVKKDHDAVL